MIYYIVTGQHRYTIDRFMAALGERPPVRIVPVTYGDLFKGMSVEPATVIFSDLERLGAEMQEAAATIWQKLRRSGLPFRLVNHPTGAMLRYELLRTLFEQGINDFNVYRLTEARRPQRYPVFLRSEDDHRGSETHLLRSAAKVDAVVGRMAAREMSRDTRMLVEYRAAPDRRGLFRVYTAQCIAGTVIPRSVAFSSHWVVKRSTVELDDELLAQEREYLATNPHAEFVRRVFRIARIGYGRMDYTVIDGRPQAYEINTNPQLVYQTATVRQARHFPDLPSVTDRLAAALAALDGRPIATGGAPRSKIAPRPDPNLDPPP